MLVNNADAEIQMSISFYQDIAHYVPPEETLIASDALLFSPPVREHWGAVVSLVAIVQLFGNIIKSPCWFACVEPGYRRSAAHARHRNRTGLA